MTPERWEQIKTILDDVLNQDPGNRNSYLDIVCADDKLLKMEVEKLIGYDKTAEDFLETPVISQKPRVLETIKIRGKLEIGTILDKRYLIEQILEVGGFSVTYLAYDQRHKRNTVVKVLNCKKENSWTRKKFHTEIKALLKLNHPNIVSIYDSGNTQEDVPYIVMEYINGYSLENFITPSGMSFEHVASIIKQLGEAISFVHQQGIYHRDLKPKNIIISYIHGREIVKIIDFGISTVKESLTDETEVTKVAGTLAYMAPEQLEGKPSAATDIYALGVIAYEMLTGKLPFDMAETSSSTPKRRLSPSSKNIKIKPCELRKSLSPRAEEELLKAMSYEQKDRHSSAKEFADLLASSLMLEHKPDSKKYNSPQKEKFSEPSFTHTAPPQIKTFLPYLALSFFLVIVSFAIIKLSDRQPLINTSNTTLTKKNYKMNFWGEIQPSNATSTQPIKLAGGISGELYFSMGDKLRLFTLPEQDGYIYFINEKIKSDQTTTYKILRPIENTYKVAAKSKMLAFELKFDQTVESEKIWIIWSENSLADIDKISQKLNSSKEGMLITEFSETNTIKHLLDQVKKERTIVQSDLEQDIIKLSSSSDKLVHTISLKQR